MNKDYLKEEKYVQNLLKIDKDYWEEQIFKDKMSELDNSKLETALDLSSSGSLISSLLFLSGDNISLALLCALPLLITIPAKILYGLSKKSELIDFVEKYEL